jgi:hypothetical protein
MKARIGSMRHVMAALLATTIGACDSALPINGDKDKDDTVTSSGSTDGTGAKSIEMDMPTDSTGKDGSANFAISGATNGLSLAEQTSIAVDSTTTIDSAKVAIRNIKIKASHQLSDDERTLKAELKTLEKAEKSENKSTERRLEQQKKTIEAEFEVAKEAAKTDEEKLEAKQKLKTAMLAIEVEKAAAEAQFEAAKTKREAAKDKNVRWGGPFMFDAVAGTLDQSFPQIELTDGSYRRIEFKLHVARDLEADDPMLNKSVYIAGRVVKAGVEVPFEVSCSASEELRLTAKTGLKIAAGVSNNVMLVLDAKAWLMGIVLSNGVISSDGVIRINESENKAIFKQFRYNMRSMTKFGKDEDGNGEVASAESSGDGVESVTELETESESYETESQKEDESSADDDEKESENESDDK